MQRCTLPDKRCTSHGMCLYQVMMTLHFLNDVVNADPGEMLHFVIFHLGIHCLPYYSIRGFKFTNDCKGHAFIVFMIFII